MRLKIIVLVFLGFFSFKNIFSQSIGNPSLPTVSQEEIIGSASVCGNYEENYAVIFETGDEECSFFYTWNVEGGIITANNDTTITGESISSVKVTWDPSKSDHQISFTATNQIQPADDGGGGSFCTSEDIVQKNGSLDINVFGNASTPLDLANWKFDDTSNDKSYACVENENIIVTQTTPMISGAQTRLTYTTDGGATIHTIKDWDQLSVGGEYNFTPSFDKMHVKVTFFNEVRYKNCIDKYEDDEFVMDFYVEPEFQKISTYDPQCEGENGSVTYEITRGSASSVIVFLDRPSGSDDSFQVEVDANNRFSLSSSDSVKKYNATAETFTKVPLNLPADTYNITLEPLIRKDKGEDAENLCFQAKTFIIKDPPSVTPKSNFSSTSYTVDCSYSTAKVEYQLQRSGDTNAKFDYRIYAADGTTIVTSDYNSSEKLSKTLGYGDYTIMAKYSDCSWSNSDAVKERNISINYHNVDFTSGYPKTSDLLDNDKHLNCSSDTDASIFVKANDTQNGLVKYKLTKVTGSNQGTEWLTGKNENEQHEFPNLGAGRYIIDAYYNGCDTRSDRATVNITAPNPIIISKVTESTPTCFGGDDGYFDFTFNGENNSNFSITSVIVKNDGETLDENSYSYSGTIVKELSAGDEVVYLEVTESGGTNLSDCHGDITLSEKMSNPSDYFQFERQIIKDPICYDSEATFKYSFQNEEGTVIRTLLDANLDPVTDPNIIENADSIIFYGPARNSTYFLQLEDGFPCTILSDPISFNIPDQPSMANPKVNEAEGGIELNGEYYVQCKDDKISITWPINFDSNTGNVSDDFTITKNGVELDEDNGDYITYADSIVLHNANVIGSIATTYRITGTDGDGCTLSEADNSNSFTLRQVENEFKLDDVETKIKVWYKDKDSSDYHLKHAADTLGTIFMKAMGGMTLEDGSQNYIYSLFDADADTLITESVDKGANDIYAFDSLLQAHKNYRVEVKDQLGCLKSFPFKLNAPDTIKIETTLNTSYAGGVNIACKNGTDTVKVQTSGGLYPHFVELKSGENTYFSQTINSSEDTVVFPNVSAGNYYIQVIDKSDNSHYPSGFRYMTRFENFDMVEPEDSVDFNYTMNEPTCFYSLDGELTITPSGGIPFENDEYVMVFYNEAGTIVLDSIRGTSATYIDSAGFYKVEVYDANSFNYNTSCSIKDSVLEIKNIPQLKTDILYSDYPLCLGDSTGKIHVRATGGRSAENYSFELYDSTKTLIDSLILSDTNEHIFENLFSGQYTVKIYDEVSCEFSQDIFLKERTDTLKIVNLKPIESTCSNTIDAAIDVTTSGGDGRHSLSIDQGQNWIQLDSGDYNYQFTDLAGGQLYEIWLKDENYYENSYQSSCLIIDNVEIARTDSVMLSADVEQVSCFGGNDGSIKINPSYGENTNSENFSFEWYKNGELLENETSDQIENLSRGSYNVKVTYGNIDCSQKSLEIGISQPSKPFAIDSITAQAYNCETSDPLKLQVNLSGGWISQKYKVQIDNLIPDSVQIDEYNTLSVYENLEYGDHQITVWDAKGCEVSDSFSIDYQRPVIDVIEVSNVNCNGEATGSIKVSGQYEIMDYYLWNDSIDFDLESQHQDSVLFNGLAAGQYNLWNKKGNCSSDTIIITITEPTKLQLNPYIVSEATCGQNNGQLDVNIEGGTPPYLTTWLNSIDPNAVGTGDYRVTVEDSLGCSFTSEISMIEVSPIEIVIDSLKDSYCNLNNGFAEVSVNGASPPFTINWNGVESGNSKSGLSPGQYEIEVVDALECTQSISFEIKEPLPVKTNVVEYREAECNIANGYIRFEYENLKSPYEIIWPESLNSLDDFSANGLAAGEMYSLQIIDSADCSHEFSFNIPDKSDLSIDFEVKRPSCENENGLIKAEVTGGSGDYNYTWSTGEENLDSISNLSAGFYFLTVEDALGCKVTDSVSLVDDPNVFPGYEIIKTEPTCLENDGVIEIQFLEQDHDFEIYWPNHFMVSNRMENLTAGIYSVVLRNPDGCNKEISIELATFQKPNLEVESIKMPGCGNANGEILITESSDLNYVWSNPSIGNTFHAENLFAGNYWVYAETQSQCKTDTLFFTLDNIDSDLLIQTQSIISNSCPNSNDGSIQINVSGGVPPYSYLWNDPEQQTQAEVIDLKAGNYTVLVTDANDCSTSKSFNLQSENPVFIASFEQIEPQCSDSYDGSLTVNVGGGKGNYTYEWSNGDTTQTADSLALGNYSVKVYDGTNCFVYEEVTLTGPNPIDIQLESGMPICRGEATGYANLNIFGGSGEYDVLWEDGNTQASRSDLASGSHLVSIQDDNGCEREFEIVVPVKKDINVQYTVIEPSCFGASDGQIEINNVFNAANPYVEWEDGARGFLRQNLTSGLYVYSITDNNNCAIQDTIAVGTPAPLEVINLNLQNPLCYGESNGSISFDVQGGSGNYQYQWDDGFINKNRSSLKDGIYQITIQDDNGCSLTKEFVITQPETITIDYEVSPVSCFGNSDGVIDLDISGGVGGYTVNWNDNVTSNNRSNLVTGTYFVSVIDSNGCESSQQIVVPEPSPLDIAVNKQQPSCNGGTDGQLTVEISGGNKPYEIKWEDGTTGNTLDSLTAGNYSINIEDAKGCEFSTSISLNQPSIIRVSEEITENPICYQEPTGFAEIIPTGGAGDYSIEWHDGDTLFQRNDLMAGEHLYTIFDENGCSYSDKIELEDPEKINIEGLPEEVYLCGSGSLILDGGEKWESYQWTANNGFSSDNREAEINQEGTYTLYTTNSDGCTDDYTFEVYKDDDLIDSDFLLTSDAIVGDTVIIVDVSWPVPDSVHWDNRDNPDIYVVSQNETYQEVIFTQTGDFEVGMRAHISLCRDDIRKTIKVMSPEVAEMQREMQAKLGNDIQLDVNVFPNPNYGVFRLDTRLNNPGDIEIHVFDLNKGRVITSLKGKENEHYVFDIDNQSLPSGVYLVMAQSGGKTVTKKFIVK